MTVKVSELRSICETLLNHLEENGFSTIEITSDFYWNIPEGTRYDRYEEPKEFTMGQLSDDWNELQKILRGNREPLGYALVWYSAILRAIGEKVVR
jgi:hypothetical protein